jgi:DNA-binding transcriptional LysR family regulator
MLLDSLDVKHLRMFEAVYSARHVTRAAETLGVSQPTLSIGLARLREQFADPLFIRTNEGMLPTPRAETLIAPVRDVLLTFRHLAESEKPFDPRASKRAFRIAMTDASHVTLLPQLLAAVRERAPDVTLEVGSIDGNLPAALQSGDAALALGLIPELEAGFYQQSLYEQDFICIARRSNPIAGERLTRARYRKASHIAIVSGTGQVLLEDALRREGLERNVVLRLPGFLGLTGVVAASDLIVTLPRHIGETLAELAGLHVHACPFSVPRFTVKQHWHARFHTDPANRWIRQLCAELFRGRRTQ